mmetsp:Transcript_18180/g.58937  ORF Transcript_18180/g.58937 Transcript_18180/m.58937 type:complete len:227 (+) Transcript_18180:210-890(+)
MVLRNSLGMIMSVSMFWMSSGAARPVSVTNGVMPPPAAASPSPPPAVASALIWGPVEAVASAKKASIVGVDSGGASKDPFSTSPSKSRTSVSVPVTAAAAAMMGDMRCVRPPLPWRPSKLRFDVDAHRSWGLSLSGFIARHMEQPGSRHSKPAASRILSKPSASACSLTRPLPGTTIARSTFAATFRPSATAATARMSSMRPFVQDPMKTMSTGTSASFVPGSRPM